MSRFDADFSYAIVNDVLKIWELELGNRSVTNDTDNVLAKIEDTEGRSFAGRKIMYRDRMGFWDVTDFVIDHAGEVPNSFARAPLYVNDALQRECGIRTP